MTKTTSLLSALLCTLIWGTTFIAQDTGMDEIGPFTFNAVRFFVGFLAIIPLVFLFELKKLKSELKSDFKTFGILSFLIGSSLFLGSALQQVALLYTDVANAAFFTPIINYPEVAILGIGKSQKKQIFINGKFKSRTMLPLSLSYDHRIIDGAEAARFNNDLKENLGKNFAYKLAI